MTVEIERDGGVATVTISRPDARNAMNYETQTALRDTLREVETDDSARCVVLRGDPEGEAFSTGADVKEIMMYGGSGTPPELAERIQTGLHQVVRSILDMNKPVVSFVDGPAVGAGCNIAIAADLTYATPGSEFGFVFTRIGLTQDTGSSYLLPRLVGMKTAKELAFTGETVGAERAEELGLVNSVVQDDTSEFDRMVEDLASGPTKAIGSTKELLHHGADSSLGEALDREAWAQAAMFESDDMREGVEAFVGDREPEFEGK